MTATLFNMNVVLPPFARLPDWSTVSPRLSDQPIPSPQALCRSLTRPNTLMLPVTGLAQRKMLWLLVPGCVATSPRLNTKLVPEPVKVKFALGMEIQAPVASSRQQVVGWPLHAPPGT